MGYSIIDTNKCAENYVLITGKVGVLVEHTGEDPNPKHAF